MGKSEDDLTRERLEIEEVKGNGSLKQKSQIKVIFRGMIFDSQNEKNILPTMILSSFKIWHFLCHGIFCINFDIITAKNKK